MLSEKNKQYLNLVSEQLEINPTWLYELIKFESKWNPSAKNPVSSARGLIQFTDKTSKGLGYKDSKDLVNNNPTIVKQLLNPVFKYLSRYKPFNTKQSLFMSVFYPAYRNSSPDRVFPAIVTKYNPNIYTPQDYMDYVAGKKKTLRNIIPLLFLVGGIILLINYNKRGMYATKES